MRGARWLHWVWSSEPAEVYRSYETPNELLQRVEASTQPDSLRNHWPSDYAILMKRTSHGVRLRIRSRSWTPMFAYVRLRHCEDDTEVSLTFGYGPLFDTFAWIGVAPFVVFLALAPRDPGVWVEGTLALLVVLLLRRLGRSRFGLYRRSQLRSVVVSGLRQPPSDDAAGVGQTA